MIKLDVAAIMTRPPLTTVRPTDSLEHALFEMMRAEVRHLPVVDRDGRLCGILSHRDLVAAGPDCHGRVTDLMATEVIAVAPDNAAHEAAYLLLRHPISCLPVTDGTRKLVGLLTATDFVRVAHRLLGGEVTPDQLEQEDRDP